MSKRERFDRYARARSLPLDRMADGRYRNMHANEAWLAWQAACPEGWQCVPTHRPTIDMTEAGSCHVMRGQDYERAQACWMAMLAAAPKPEDAE